MAPPVISQSYNNGRPGRPWGVRSRLDREYTAAGTLYPWAASYYQSLPEYIDDLGRDLGADIYERMQHDSQVSACVHVLKVGTLAQPVALLPAVEDEEAPERQRAVEIKEFCERCLKRLKDLKTKTLYNLLDAIPMGHKVAEVTYELAESGRDAGKLVLKNIKVKPRQSYAFVVDVYLNVIGLLAIIPDKAPMLLQGTMLDPKAQPNLLPRSKFAVLSMREKDEDPRGTSFLRPAYDPWWQKVQAKPEGLKHIAQFGGASMWATTPEGAQDVAELDENGVAVTDDAGNPLYISPEVGLSTELIKWANGVAAAFPFGTEIHVEKPAGNWEAFRNFFEFQDRQIAMSILLQDLATKEGQHMARAAAQTHQDVLGLVVHYCRHRTEEMLACDVLARLVEYNFGAEALSLTPRVSLGDVQEQDLVQMWMAVAALFKAGAITPSMYRSLCSTVGLPPPEPADVERMQEQQEMQNQLRGKQAEEEDEEEEETRRRAA